MSQTTVELVRRWFEAANRREFQTVMSMYADDVELVVSEAWLNGGTYSGKEAVGRFFGDWFRTFDGGPHFELLEMRDAGDAVAVSAQATARGGQSGVELSTDYFYVIGVRDGQVVHVEFYDDWAAALAAAGLPA
ncbi:MAG: nuclear transport factor 2 family protein [Thermoleophilaceae bacterium]